MQENTRQADNSGVLVIGGGVGGIKVAMDLSEAGRNVVLIDKAPSIGGLMTRLDRTFPTNNCDLCALSSQFSESGRQRHIELLPLTELAALEGDAGNFTATLVRKQRFIDVEKCTACGECLKQFPECVRFTPGLDHRAPTCMRYPQSTPYAYSIDADKVEDAEALAACCPAEAISMGTEETRETRAIGSVVLATGAELFDPAPLDNYSHSACPDVVTGLEYERIMSASGPTGGELVRPSDGRQPAKVAWIQCVGSRGFNREDVPYCSGVCCMYALKEAIVTKERFQDDIEATIFYMDMRTFGKDYERYSQRAKDGYGVRFVRCKPHSVSPVDSESGLMIQYATDEESGHITEEFDMVVLSTGFRPSAALDSLAGTLGIELDDHRFVQTGAFDPVTTSREGVYVCGVAESPKDIPETLVQASAAACRAAGPLPETVARDEGEDPGDLPSERDISGEDPRIGVFVCECGQNIGNAIDVGAVVDHAATLPGVVLAEAAGHGCSIDAVERIKSVIREGKINRVVIGGCSPRTHERMFQNALQQAGLNRYLVEIANIRDQNTWVHANDSEAGTGKAAELVRMAVAAISVTSPLTDHVIPVNKDVLVMGGGVTGMNAALELADQGFKVFLAEQSPELGGLARTVRTTLDGGDVPAYVAALIEKTKASDNIEVVTSAILADHSGMPGMYKTGFQIGPRMYYRQIEHGATILATGAVANRPPEYLLGESDAVRTHLDLDGLLADQPETVDAWDTVVMIQCVGSRVPENPNCSRVCCQAAVKNALALLERKPELQVFVLYRDMRTYGMSELAYQEARKKGVIFVRYSPEDKPVVAAAENGVTVLFTDPIIGRKIEVTADCLSLGTGLIANDEATEDMAAIFHLNRTTDGYFLEDHIKLKPIELTAPGFFVAGTAHAPKTIKESVGQAQAAASRVQAVLAKDGINLGASVARVESSQCAACLICVRACPYGVPFINADGYSQIDPAKCQGCGVCAAECPAKAIQLVQFEDDLIMAKVNGLLEGIAR